MRMMDELKHLMLYPAKKKVYIPIDEKERRKNSAILLLTPTLEESLKLMKLPYIYNPNLFQSFYVDRNVMAYINGNEKNIDVSDIEDFDEVEAEKLSEAILPVRYKTKLVFDEDHCTMTDIRYIRDILTPQYISSICKTLKINDPESVEICTYVTTKKLREAAPKEYTNIFGDRLYSFSKDNKIHIKSKYNYDPEYDNGDYDLYVKSEFINCMIQQMNPKLPLLGSKGIAYALSGLEQWLIYNKDCKVDRSNIEWKFAHTVNGVIATNGMKDIIKYIKTGDMNVFIKYNIKGMINDLGIKVFGESEAFNERYVISDNDKEYNLKDWRPNKQNILYVTGLSGGGKSTTARDMAYYYHATYIELDKIWYSHLYIKDPKDEFEKLISQYCKKTGQTDDILSVAETRKEVDKFFLGCFDYIYEYMKKHNNRLFVVEGVQLPLIAEQDINKDEILKSPFIIKGTSVLQSIIRRKDRDGDKEFFDNLQNALRTVQMYLNMEKNMNKIRNLRSGVQESASLSDEESNLTPEYSDVLNVCAELNSEELKRITFYDTYRNSKYVIQRIIVKDEDNNPIGFLDVYQFPSNPEIAQITLAVKDSYQSAGVGTALVKEMLNRNLQNEFGFAMYYWTVNPGNIASARLATKCGFINTEKTDKYGRDIYLLPVTKSDPIWSEVSNALPSNGESVITENGTFYNDTIAIFSEADNEKLYSRNIRKYLYSERLKNNKAVLEIYERVKKSDPNIKRTYAKLKMYKKFNLWVDLSYYHGIFLEKNIYKLDRAINFYFDFLNRLINNSEIDAEYKKKTIFIPVDSGVWPIAPGTDITDWKKNLNPISILFRLVRNNLGALRSAWGNKDIIFVGSRGYFTIDFSKFELKNLNKLKTNLRKLMSTDEVIEDEEEIDNLQSDDEDSSKKNVDSKKALATKIIDKIEKNTDIKVDDISGVNFSKPDLNAPEAGIAGTELNIRTGGVSFYGIDMNEENNTVVISIDPNGPDGFEKLSGTVINDLKDITLYVMPN